MRRYQVWCKLYGQNAIGQNATGENATGQNATREVNVGRTKCHWRGQLLAHALSQTNLLRHGSYFFFLWSFLLLLDS